MSAMENRKLMQEIFASAAAGDASLFVEHLAHDVTVRVTGQCSWSQTVHGKEALLRDLYGHVSSVTRGPRKTIALRFIADEDYVVVEARGEMFSKEGVPYNNDYCLIYRLQDGKIVEITEYQDSALCERVLGKYPATRPHN